MGVRDAAKKLKLSRFNIYEVLYGRRDTEGGYKWSYADEQNKQLSRQKMRVMQLTLNEEPVAVYEGILEASTATGISTATISNVATGKRESVFGYKWKYL